MIEWEYLLHLQFSKYRYDSEILFEFLVVYFLIKYNLFLYRNASAQDTGLTMQEAELQTNLQKL